MALFNVYLNVTKNRLNMAWVLSFAKGYIYVKMIL